MPGEPTLREALLVDHRCRFCDNWIGQPMTDGEHAPDCAGIEYLAALPPVAPDSRVGPDERSEWVATRKGERVHHHRTNDEQWMGIAESCPICVGSAE